MNPTATAVVLFAVATGVAMLARPLRLPYVVVLVGVGLVLGATHVALPVPHLTRELIYETFLPGLLFEAAFRLDARDFWASKASILLLAIPGVLMGIAITALILVAAGPFATGLAGPSILVFATLIAATDPVAVIAIFRDLRAPPRLTVIIEGESLVNDGTAVVLYSIAVGSTGWARSGMWSAAAADFVLVVGLGATIGVAFGFAMSAIIARVDDPVVEIALTTITAYGSFALGEQLHASGVLATVAAGMVCGSYGAPRGMSSATRIAVGSFWEYIAFALNSIVFLMIGFEVRTAHLVESARAVVIAYAAVMVARFAVVGLASLVLRASRERMPWRWNSVLAWGGIRGALSIVLALALPDGFPGREAIVRLTFGVTVVSILLNGLTMNPLLQRLSITTPNARDATKRNQGDFSP